MVDNVQISKKVLDRLINMDYERNGGLSGEQLIFPMKIQAKGTKQRDRISEQELRQLFIEEFKITYKKLYYSIETPTVSKYSFSNELNEKKIADIVNLGQSALIDMCVFDKENDSYKRILNIEFKHKNATKDNISKDILKLMHEQQNGAFILLLKNTNSETLKSVFSKFSSSFLSHTKHWTGIKDKFIEVIILSLEEKKDEKGIPFLIHRRINQDANLVDVFNFDGSLADINEVKRNGWEIDKIEKKCIVDV